jgi:hypothetical protein
VFHIRRFELGDKEADSSSSLNANENNVLNQLIIILQTQNDHHISRIPTNIERTVIN